MMICGLESHSHIHIGKWQTDGGVSQSHIVEKEFSVSLEILLPGCRGRNSFIFSIVWWPIMMTTINNKWTKLWPNILQMKSKLQYICRKLILLYYSRPPASHNYQALLHFQVVSEVSCILSGLSLWVILCDAAEEETPAFAGEDSKSVVLL